MRMIWLVAVLAIGFCAYQFLMLHGELTGIGDELHTAAHDVNLTAGLIAGINEKLGRLAILRAEQPAEEGR